MCWDESLVTPTVGCYATHFRRGDVDVVDDVDDDDDDGSGRVDLPVVVSYGTATASAASDGTAELTDGVSLTHLLASAPFHRDAGTATLLERNVRSLSCC